MTATTLMSTSSREVDLVARMEHNLRHAPLAGFVVEGLSPYGIMTSLARHRLMLRAVHCGMPVVRVGRGNNAGFTPRRDRLMGGGNLTATKARLLLMACLMKFGSLPPARDPDHPTEAEATAIRSKVSAYQAVFDTH
jgi:L-asparaginase